MKLRGEGCYSNLPVVQTDNKGEPVISKKLFFLEPRSRILQPLGLEYKCDAQFNPFFLLNNGQYIAYTGNGLITNIHHLQPIKLNSSFNALEFKGEDFTKKALYDFKQIDQYNDLIATSAKKAALESVVANNLDVTIASKPGVKPFYSYFSDLSLFTTSLDESFRRFGSYSGGFFSIFAMFIFGYNMIMCSLGLRSIDDVRGKTRLDFSPTNYLLRKDREAVYLNETQGKRFGELLKN